MDRESLDIFPSRVLDSVAVLKHPGSKSGFNKIYSSGRVHAATCWMRREKLYYAMTRTWNDKLLAHFFLTGKESSRMPQEFRPNEIVWDHIRKRLEKHGHAQSNTDVRTCFVYEDTNFLVKSCFTFGQRTVERGTWHVYQTTDIPLVFYALNRNKMHEREPPLILNRGFRSRDQYFYHRFVLERFSKYRILPGTIYVLVAAQKTLFSVHVVREGTQLPFKCSDPCYPRQEEDVYDKPPATPALDQINAERRQMEEHVAPRSQIKIAPFKRPEFKVPKRVETLEPPLQETIVRPVLKSVATQTNFDQITERENINRSEDSTTDDTPLDLTFKPQFSPPAMDLSTPPPAMTPPMDLSFQPPPMDLIFQLPPATPPPMDFQPLTPEPPVTPECIRELTPEPPVTPECIRELFPEPPSDMLLDLDELIKFYTPQDFETINFDDIQW